MPRTPYPFLRWLLVLSAALLLAACGGGGNTAAAPATPPSTTEPPSPSAELAVLMMGNSHTSLGDLPRQLRDLLRAGQPAKAVTVEVAPGWMFLEERVSDAPTLALLRSRRWSAVVLQAQKYSSSGQFVYSTAEAEALIRMTRAGQALPVLFPEWPRRGIEETQRIYQLHTGIAAREPACVPAIGQAWDLALSRHPALQLYDADGNHANEAGAQLAALMLYAGITGQSPRALPVIAGGVDVQTQQWLREAAGDMAQAFPPRQFCPADALN